MDDLIIGKGNLAGKGVYANRDFKKGEVVTKYKSLPGSEKKIYTYTLGSDLSLLRT